MLLDIASPPAPAADAAGAGAAAAAAAGGGGGPALPWALTVHYRDVPAALVPAWCNAGAAREQYFTSLKVRGARARGARRHRLGAPRGPCLLQHRGRAWMLR